MSQRRKTTFYRAHKNSAGKTPAGGNVSEEDSQQVSAAAQKLSRSFEGRQLLQAAANLEQQDLGALANFATAASRGAW